MLFITDACVFPLSRMYSLPNEIGGHHIVYAVTNGSYTTAAGRVRRGREELRVVAVPLQHHLNSDKTSVMNVGSFINSGSGSGSERLQAWLPNLAFGIAADQLKVKRMRHDDKALSGGGDWTCPLRQALLWSGQLDGFLPVVPNPLRASRLYGQIVLPYHGSTEMDVHPTAEARDIDRAQRLHTQYWTTNGFCVYKGADALGTNPTPPSSEACSLQALANSVLGTGGALYHNFTTVFGSGGACTAQVCTADVPASSNPLSLSLSLFRRH